jgi:hypothetical protein
MSEKNYKNLSPSGEKEGGRCLETTASTFATASAFTT